MSGRNRKKIVICAIASSMLVLGMVLNGQAAVTLEVWDQWYQPHQEKAIEMMDANFEKMHPGVKIDRTAMPVREMSTVIKPALAAGTGPDVMYGEVGLAFLGPLIKAGTIMDLTDAWKERGWDEKLISTSRDTITYGGRVWGIGNELEYIGIGYNKEIFADLGVQIPKSIAEMEQISEKALDEGYIPMAWGARDWWQSFNLVNPVIWSLVGKGPAYKASFEGGTWKVPGMKEALYKSCVEWKKFYVPNPAAIGGDDANMAFFQGRAAMQPDAGTWQIPMYRDNITDFEVGHFLWPRPDATQTPVTVAYCGSGYQINSATKHPDAAIDYLDYLMASEEAARIWYEVAAYMPPWGRPIRDLKLHPLMKIAADRLTGGKGVFLIGLSLTAPPEAHTFLSVGTQEVITGQRTVDEFVEEWERLWEKGRREGMTKDTFEL